MTTAGYPEASGPAVTSISLEINLPSGEVLAVLQVEPSWTGAATKQALESHIPANKRLLSLTLNDAIFSDLQTLQELGFSADMKLVAVLGPAVLPGTYKGSKTSERTEKVEFDYSPGMEGMSGKTYSVDGRITCTTSYSLCVADDGSFTLSRSSENVDRKCSMKALSRTGHIQDGDKFVLSEASAFMVLCREGSKSVWKEADLVSVAFSGSAGYTFADSGRVTSVGDDTPAKQQGVEVGWTLVQVDDEPVRKALVQEKISSGEEYHLFFMKTYPEGALVRSTAEFCNSSTDETLCEKGDLGVSQPVPRHWKAANTPGVVKVTFDSTHASLPCKVQDDVELVETSLVKSSSGIWEGKPLQPIIITHNKGVVLLTGPFEQLPDSPERAYGGGRRPCDVVKELAASGKRNPPMPGSVELRRT